MIALAVATGIAPSVWADEGAKAITTASKILEQQEKQANGNHRTPSEPGQGSPYSGVQMSG
ncbi:hypothetical protein [Amycolatopsis sp. H20-H5]|uniref:hypothetical protein n=1 Tax=Amycolatopsis sp. H20-H5 TaxID=3046309 RepID=UPI002DBE4710|nr:hypothetical protein [Amycolatopsis sp. H20-H5]MEC3975086.1 hypothetical protein [Amycolatopsis sp. H20-H5]